MIEPREFGKRVRDASNWFQLFRNVKGLGTGLNRDQKKALLDFSSKA